MNEHDDREILRRDFERDIYANICSDEATEQAAGQAVDSLIIPWLLGFRCAVKQTEREAADLHRQVLLDTGNIERMQAAGAQAEATIAELRRQLEKRVAEEQKAYEQRVAAAHRNIDILQRTQNERNEQKARAEQAEADARELWEILEDYAASYEQPSSFVDKHRAKYSK